MPYYPSLSTTSAAKFNYTAQTTGYNAAINDYVDCTSGTFNVTLPSAAGNTGQSIVVKNSGTGTIALNTTSSQTVDGLASGKVMLVADDSCMVTSDGSNWKLTSYEFTIFAKAYLGNSSSATTLANNSETVLDFANSKTDTWSAITTGSGWKFTAPFPGIYQVSCYLQYDAVASGGVNNQFWANLFVNGGGTNEGYISRTVSQASATFIGATQGSQSVKLSAGDYIQLKSLQNSGSTVTFSGSSGRGESWIAIKRIG